MNVKKYVVFIMMIWRGTTEIVSAQTGIDSLVINPKIIGLKTQYGFIIPHRKELKDVAQSSPWVIQVEYSKHINTQKTWDYCGCYPKLGFAFNYTNYDNPEILGNSFTGMVFLEPYISYGHRINPSFRLGLGLSYLDQVYDPVTNPRNLFYSYPLSFFMYAGIGLNFRLNEIFDLNLFGNYSHISNGGIKQPNKGINFPTVSLGVDYKLQPVAFKDRHRQMTRKELHQKLWKADLTLYTSRKDVVENERKYQVYGLQLTGGYIFSRMSAINLGFEFNYDLSVKERNRRNPESNFQDQTLALLITHELLMGKFILDQGVGYYLNRPSPRYHYLYQRLGLRYRIHRDFNFGLSMKTHTSVADFIDLRISYML